MGALLTCCALLLGSTTEVYARDVTELDPSYPRIANCYGSRLGWESWEKGAGYWSKVDLIIGGCYDLHYDWDDARWERVIPRLEQNIALLREANPTALVLPYVDVIEGPDNPDIPEHWWDLRDGERWSGWPGFFRINMKLPDVLQFNLDKVRDQVMAREMFDGVFYDCWGPDPWLVPRTAQLRDGKAVVMLNEWNLPTDGHDSLNGCLAEDELNRVIEGKVDFEEFLGRYLRWSNEGRKPAITTIVCHPRDLDMDPWAWSKVDWQERTKLAQDLQNADPQTMRFGLTTTLMGDGYFAYDCANLGRGQWWWYPEFDAPLGKPVGSAIRNADGTWQREFEGGLVVTNGASYDAVVELPAKRRDMSTGRVGTTFTIPMFDGRIFLPTDEAPTAGPDIEPRLTAGPPDALRVVTLEDGITVVQAPDGLELRFTSTGELRNILLNRQMIMTGGWPVVAAPPMRHFAVEDSAEPLVSTTDQRVELTFAGDLVEGDQRVRFTETCSIEPHNRFTLRFDYEAVTDANFRLFRHYFFLPVHRYAGAAVTDGEASRQLPREVEKDTLLAGAQQLEITTGEHAVIIDSSVPMSLVDHRQWGSEDYLLAGYPVSGEVKRGATWSVEITTRITAQ
ncbi:MAG TPA: putative glycoside hydrolase [Armatimonadota bacterium]|nr:putative glycoside hydrolase [Armatimonadota bacterium]